MVVPNGHYALLHNNPLEKEPNRGQMGRRNGGLGSRRSSPEVLGTTIIGEQYLIEDAPRIFSIARSRTTIFSSKAESFPFSPQQISAWATKILPNRELVGEVTKPYTFHYKTNKPEKYGLLCERIFGPIKSGICACGNYRVIGDEKEDPKFCEQCGVEFIHSRIRRYQMGYIKLACPVTHVWYLKCLPSYIANLLDKPLKN
ncbi:hypothetical protein H5410_014942 [Solanum commersonii]|uniref:DNA-directed RNA polymerase n=1 Tax=Solanum commersonii TaxID=4109 RepID=A0A9J5ZSC3_SOLCO|nr:hypothetical protein H5410_014942 [Solanum commersonii]